MREFIIDKNSDGIRLDKFMCGVMPNISFGEVCKALRKKKVRVNGKHKDGTHRVSNGEHIQIYMNDEFFETNSPIHDFSWKNCPTDTDIEYEDENILIANKPSGLPSQADGGADLKTGFARCYLKKAKSTSRQRRFLFRHCATESTETPRGLSLRQRTQPRCVPQIGLSKIKRYESFICVKPKKRRIRRAVRFAAGLLKTKRSTR